MTDKEHQYLEALRRLIDAITHADDGCCGEGAGFGNHAWGWMAALDYITESDAFTCAVAIVEADDE